jgi:hypothetical protein
MRFFSLWEWNREDCSRQNRSSGRGIFIYTQLYFHLVRRVYDFHLKQFLREWLPNGKFSIDLADHLHLTDTEVVSAMRLAASNKSTPGHELARRIMQPKHGKRVADITEADRDIDPMAAELLSAKLSDMFGSGAVFTDRYTQKGKESDSLCSRRMARSNGPPGSLLR